MDFNQAVYTSKSFKNAVGDVCHYLVIPLADKFIVVMSRLGQPYGHQNEFNTLEDAKRYADNSATIMSSMTQRQGRRSRR